MIHHAKSHPSQETKGVYKLAIVGLVVAAAFIWGCAGFLEHARAHHEHASFAGVIYHTIQLFVLHSPHFSCEPPPQRPSASVEDADIFLIMV